MSDNLDQVEPASNPPDWMNNIMRGIYERFPDEKNFEVVRIKNITDESNAYRIKCNDCIRLFIIRKGQVNFANHLTTNIHTKNKNSRSKHKAQEAISNVFEQNSLVAETDKENSLNANRKRLRSPLMKPETRETIEYKTYIIEFPEFLKFLELSIKSISF
ncbi:11766_t:CDS:2 [Diversispora eburnea]|uniref:11766_t:CDS:1 n=1 Tax=Diversispora eburnea TaxID=1213867 RepID=A0A9N8W6F4_9GLOM|nr:11766_t:CDS:2 [Diversispora eburnea]